MRGMDIGVMNSLRNDVEGNLFQHVAGFGLNVCQLVNWNPDLWTRELAQRVVRDSKASGVRVCALWTGVPGPAKWNMVEGHTTLGLVPPEYRAMRVEALKKGADFAKQIGVPAIITHCGFIPEEPTHPYYEGTIAAIRDIAAYCKKLRLGFWFETGQETPVTLLRAIEDIGTGNLGINLDPANLILYGKGNPIDALDVFGKYVRNIHAKDGLYPTTGRELGHEVAVGKGCVRFPEFLKKLHKIGFRGELIIEREISGAQQTKDIRKTVNDLKCWKARLK
jgi:sugar phosphate isomerase/epimerase